MNVVGRQSHHASLTFSNPSGHFSANRADLALEIPQPGLTSVLRDDGADSGVGELDVPVLQSMFAELLRN